MISVDEALSRVMAAAQPLGIETLPLCEAHQRVLAADAHSQHPLPLFTQSAVDGYALRHADLSELPRNFQLGQAVAARAQAEHPVLLPGMAMRILTGGLLPLGADTVVRQELTQSHAPGDAITILSHVALGADIRTAGEEMPQDALIAARGTRITAGLVGALALAGVSQVQVARLPRIIVLVSGDEVVRDGSALKLGQVPDANGPLLQAFLQSWGLTPLRIEAMADTADAVRDAMRRAFDEADIVLTTGGVSVGDHDYIPAVAESLGAERLLWKVAQKPGMPLYVARQGRTLLFGLPGNPASVLVNLMVYVRALLDTLQGLDAARRWHPAPATLAVKRDAEKTLWLRAVQGVDTEGQTSLQALPNQGSHMLGNLARANALLRLPPASAQGDASNISWCALQ